MKKVKVNHKTKYIILLGIFVFILFISFYFKKEGFTYSQYNNKDYKVGQLQIHNNITVDDCKNKCSEDDECKGLVIDHKGRHGSTGNCWLKNSMNPKKLTNDNTVITYKKLS